jgi:branched-chain amino acid transport system ATP-binding protein
MSETVLEARHLAAGYGEHPVVPNLDLDVKAGEIVALLGPNGAGKTTVVRTLSGIIPALGGEVLLFGEPTKASLHRRAKQGLGLVTEKKAVFMRMSTRENLRVGRCGVDSATELFPELEVLMGRKAGLLSGGEQQMLTLARALGREPRLLLADELSLGLAPLVVDRLLKTVRAAADRGVGVLLVEQSVNQALRVADRVYVLERGNVVLSGPADEARERLADIERSYLAGGSTNGDTPAATKATS